MREKYDGTKRAIRKQKTNEKFTNKANGGEPAPKQSNELSETLARLRDVIFMSVEEVPARISTDEDFVTINNNKTKENKMKEAFRSKDNPTIKRCRIESPSARSTRKTETKINISNSDIVMAAELKAVEVAEKRAFVQHTVAIANLRAVAAMEIKVLRQKEKYIRAEHVLRMKILKSLLVASEETIQFPSRA